MSNPEERWGEFFPEFNNEVALENVSAMAKHKQDYWGRHEFYAILLEEVDELWDEIKANGPDERMLAELIQVASVCQRMYDLTKRYQPKGAINGKTRTTE